MAHQNESTCCDTFKCTGVSIVASFGLKSKSRLSYAIAHRPSFDSSCIICCVSIISDLTIFPMAVTDTLHPPQASTSVTHSGVFTNSRKNPWIAWKVLHQLFVLFARIERTMHPF